MIGAVSLLIGVLSGLGAAGLPAEGWQTAASLVLLASFPWFRHSPLMRGLALSLLGLMLVCAAERRWLSLRIEPSAADERVLLEGRVLTVPTHVGAELRFDAEVRVLAGPPGARDGHVRTARLAWRESALAPRVGERWRWVARLEPLTDTRNFTGSDAARVAFRQRVHLVARILPATLDVRLELAAASIDTARARIARRVRECIADPDAAALVTALAVGLTDDLSLDQWRVFNATGTTHLVAISGLHVTMFALLAFAAARCAWRWLPGRAFVARETFAAGAGLGAAGAYALLAGLSVPTQRTWIMLAVFAGSRLVARHVGTARVWSLALIAVLLLDPLAPLSAGFWLSFTAVGVILLLAADARPVSGWRESAAAAVRMQLAIMLVLAPLTIAVFDSVSLVGLGVNLVAIPFISLLFVPLVLGGALTAVWLPMLSAPLFELAGAIYGTCWPALVWAADLDVAQWRVMPPGWWYAFTFLAVAVALRAPSAWLRLGALCALLPLSFAPTRAPGPGTVRVTVLDAGRGAASLIETPSSVWLFDTGDGWNTDGSRIRRLVLPALDAIGHPPVDALVLPGLTPERAAGAARLASERELRRVLVGGGWTASRLETRRCTDDAVERDGVTFQTYTAGPGRRFCVLRVVAGTRSILFAGDLDAAAEQGLVERLPRERLASDVVVVSRGASALGSGRQWIETASRGLAIATGGIDSSSRAAALARWREHGIAVLDTQRDGAVELVIGTRGIEVRTAAEARFPAPWPFAWRRAP